MLTDSERERMKTLRAQNFWYDWRVWPLIERSVRREWKGADMVRGPRMMRKEDESIWRKTNCAGERRRAYRARTYVW
jgi:hypothetical protein